MSTATTTIPVVIARYTEDSAFSDTDGCDVEASLAKLNDMAVNAVQVELGDGYDVRLAGHDELRDGINFIVNGVEYSQFDLAMAKNGAIAIASEAAVVYTWESNAWIVDA